MLPLRFEQAISMDERDRLCTRSGVGDYFIWDKLSAPAGLVPLFGMSCREVPSAGQVRHDGRWRPLAAMTRWTVLFFASSVSSLALGRRNVGAVLTLLRVRREIYCGQYGADLRGRLGCEHRL